MFRRSLQLNPDYVRLSPTMALRFSLCEFDAAKRAIPTRMSRAPDNDDAYCRLVFCFSNWRCQAVPLLPFYQAAKINPSDPTPYFKLPD